MLKNLTENVYYLTKSISIEKDTKKGSKKVTIPKGYAVCITKADFYKDAYLLESKELKCSQVFGTKPLLEILEEGVETLRENEIFLMRFHSGYRQYEVVGYDFDEMAKSILKLYNKYCLDCKYTLQRLSKEEYQFRVFKIKIGEAYDDDEERTLNCYIGDYLDKWRPYNDSFWYAKPYQKWNN